MDTEFDDLDSLKQLIDTIDDISDTPKADKIHNISSQLHFVASTTNHKDDNNIKEILSTFQHFSEILLTNKDIIKENDDMSCLMCSFVKTIRQWLYEEFILNIHNINKESILADFNTIIISMSNDLEECEINDDLDDLFF